MICIFLFVSLFLSLVQFSVLQWFIYSFSQYFVLIADYSQPVKDVVSWNAMITGYAHTSRFGEVLVLFEDMQREKVRPDNCTLVNMLSACAHLGALGQGEWIRAYINKNGIGINDFVATALVVM